MPSFSPKIFRSEELSENGLNIKKGDSMLNFTVSLNLTMIVEVNNPNIYRIDLSHMDLRVSLKPNATGLRDFGIDVPRNYDMKEIRVGYANAGQLIFEPQHTRNFTSTIMIELTGSDFLENKYLKPEIERVCTVKETFFDFNYVIILHNDFLDFFGYQPTITEKKGVKCPLNEEQLEQLQNMIQNQDS